MDRRQLLALLGAAPLAAAGFWEKQPFPNWTPNEVEKLLTDSPWAREVHCRFEYTPPARRLTSEFQIGFPRGRSGGGASPGVQTEVYLTVRWSSALPIRQALALQEAGRDKAAVELPPEPKEYIVEVFGLPAIMAPEGAMRVQEDLEKSASLWWKGGRTIRASSVTVPEHGMHLSAEIRFPRSPEITEESGALEFSARAGAIKIEPKFKLKPMVYRGRLEL